MRSFTIIIPDEYLPAIEHVREKHNATIPDEKDAPRDKHADYCATAEAYLQRVMINAAASYAQTHREDQVRAAIG